MTVYGYRMLTRPPVSRSSHGSIWGQGASSTSRRRGYGRRSPSRARRGSDDDVRESSSSQPPRPLARSIAHSASTAAANAWLGGSGEADDDAGDDRRRDVAPTCQHSGRYTNILVVRPVGEVSGWAA